MEEEKTEPCAQLSHRETIILSAINTVNVICCMFFPPSWEDISMAMEFGLLAYNWGQTTFLTEQ